MSWEEIVANIEHFWNQPVPIIGFTVGTVIVGCLWILSKTSIGKKAVRKLTDMFKLLESDYQKAKQDYENLITEKDNIIAEIKQDYENKLALVQANRDKEKEIIIAIAENIHNIKIKKIIEEYKQLPEIENISIYVEQVKNDLEQEYESKYQLVLKELEEIKNATKISEQIEEEIQGDTI